MKKPDEFASELCILRKDSMPTSISVRSICLILLVLFIPAISMSTEEPSFELLEKSGNFERRAYQSLIIAETYTRGPMDEASSA